MTKEEAQRAVQEKMALISALLKDCEALMDEHRFMADLPTLPTWAQITYLPRNLTKSERASCYSLEALEEDNLTWRGINEEYKDGGVWVPSSNYGDC